MSAKPDTIPMRGTFPLPPKKLNATGKKAWGIGAVLWAEGTLKERDLLNWTLFCEAVQEKEHQEKRLPETEELKENETKRKRKSNF